MVLAKQWMWRITSQVPAGRPSATVRNAREARALGTAAQEEVERDRNSTRRAALRPQSRPKLRIGARAKRPPPPDAASSARSCQAHLAAGDRVVAAADAEAQALRRDFQRQFGRLPGNSGARNFTCGRAARRAPNSRSARGSDAVSSTTPGTTGRPGKCPAGSGGRRRCAAPCGSSGGRRRAWSRQLRPQARDATRELGEGAPRHARQQPAPQQELGGETAPTPP